MRTPYFPFFVDDFLGGISDMTQTEIGAYILLLCHQWNKGSIPSDQSRLSMIAKGDVTDHVMAKFHKGVNQKLERVRKNVDEIQLRKSEAGKIAAEKRWGRKDEKPKPEARLNDSCQDGFDKFWSAYPKKVAKPDAIRAWKKVDVSLDVLLKSLECQKKSKDWTKDGGKFIPYPASWLNSRRWEDEDVSAQSHRPYVDFVPDATFDSTKA